MCSVILALMVDIVRPVACCIPLFAVNECLCGYVAVILTHNRPVDAPMRRREHAWHTHTGLGYNGCSCRDQVRLYAP